MNFLNSKQLSAFCFVVNIIFFIWMIANSAYLLSILPLIAGSICLTNVIQ